MKLLVHGKAMFANKALQAKTLLFMKMTAIFLLVAALNVSATGVSQKVTISKKNASLEEVFEMVQKQSGYSFVFNSHLLEKAKKVNLNVTDATLENVLAICFNGQPMTYVIHEKTIVVKEKEIVGENRIEPLLVTTVQPPNRVSGIVIDENNKPIEGAAVTIKKLRIGTSTNKQGKFELNVPEGTYELEITSVGYKPVQKTITVGTDGLSDISISMQVSSTGLADVVVVGYGTQRKRDVTGSISSVRGDDIKNLPVSNAAEALQGRAAGVDIVRDDGSPGSVPAIRIRGTGTINNADPLIVIDGIPSGGLNDVNSNDIASIEILKDASASAIYGSRAANGVVLISTKKGSYGGAIKTNVNLYTGSEKPVKFIDMLSAPDLVKLKNEAYTNDGLTVPTIWGNPYYAVQRTDWQKALMTSGNTKNADVAIRGGNASSNYSLSGNYFNSNGMIPNSFFNRYSFRINSEHKIGSRLRLGENVLYSNTNINAPDTKSSQTGLVWTAIRFNPAIPVKNPDGTWGTSQADNQLGDINNPVATAVETDAYNKTDRILANAYAELDIIKGLKLRANYGYDHNSGDSYNFSIAMPGQTRGPSISSLNRGSSKARTFLEEYFLTYNNVFKDVHSLTLTGGYSAQVYNGSSFSASRSGYSDTGYDQRVLNVGNLSSANNNGSNNNPSGLQSYFVRANYAFDNKYLFTATFRADGSSKFAPGKRWGYFPAFSAGWRISDEKFFKDNVKAINTLKLTGGWGQLGNQNVGDFQYLSILSTGGGGNGYNLGSPTTNYNGAYITSLANPNITWERAVMTNISLEIATLENHLSAVFTYFNKNTSDMLIPYQLVETFGAQVVLPDDGGYVTLPDYNLGQLNNHGVEIELNYQNTAGKLSYSFGATGAFQNNKITKLYGSSAYIGFPTYGRENVDISRTYEGQSISSFYGYKANGLYQTQAEIDSDPNIANDPNKPNIKPGDVKFVDVNGASGKPDGMITDKDRVNLGNPNPKFVFGLHGMLNYNHFDFSFNFAGATGFQLYDADRLAGLDATQVYNWYNEQLGRWHGQGTSNSIPRLSIDNLNSNYRSSSLWVQNGSYVSLKSLSIGYTVPRIKFSNVMLPEMRFYLSGYNLFTITGYKGYTPELGYNNSNLQRGVDLAQYPQSRNLTVGATINF